MRRSPVETLVRRYLLGDIHWVDFFEKMRTLEYEKVEHADHVFRIMVNSPTPMTTLSAWYGYMTRYRKELKS